MCIDVDSHVHVTSSSASLWSHATRPCCPPLDPRRNGNPKSHKRVAQPGFKLYGGIQSNNRDESFIYYGINHDWDMFLGDLIHSCYGIWWAWIHGDWSWDWWCFLPGHVYIYIYYNNNIHRYRALVMDLHTGYIQFQRNKEPPALSFMQNRTYTQNGEPVWS